MSQFEINILSSFEFNNERTLLLLIGVINKSSLAKNKNISRRTIYRVLSEEGNPTLESIAKVVQAVYG